jgi:hypothetical protein
MSTLSNTTGGAQFWGDIDPATREELDAQFLRELSFWDIRGLTNEGVQAYLAYRHQRPDASITTYEEGQVRKMLRRYRDPTMTPDVTWRDLQGPFGASRSLPGASETFWIQLGLLAVLIAAVASVFLFV